MLSMNKELMNKVTAEIENFRGKLGEVVLDVIMEDSNSSLDMAKGILRTFTTCNTQREFEIANDMLTGICGYSFETLIERIRELDRDENHCWASI